MKKIQVDRINHGAAFSEEYNINKSLLFRVLNSYL